MTKDDTARLVEIMHTLLSIGERVDELKRGQADLANIVQANHEELKDEVGACRKTLDDRMAEHDDVAALQGEVKELRSRVRQMDKQIADLQRKVAAIPS